MRQSRLLIPTLRDEPGEAEIVSHKLMLRAGLIRKVAAGVYTVMTTWHTGRRLVVRRLAETEVPLAKFFAAVHAQPPARVPGKYQNWENQQCA